jgi:hypothetical protein
MNWMRIIFPPVQLILQPITAGLGHPFHWSDSAPLVGIVVGWIIVALGRGVVI